MVELKIPDMRTGNPAFSSKSFEDFEYDDDIPKISKRMTVGGTVNKIAILLFLVVVSASWTWSLSASGNILPAALMMPAVICAFIVGLITIFKQSWSPFTAPVYAIFEGLVLGTLSLFFEAAYPGIVIQALVLTFTSLFALLALYKTGLVRATPKFKLIVVVATAGIAILYLINLLFIIFRINAPYLGFIHDSTPLGIAFSIFVVLLASMNFVLDFDFIEKSAASGEPKYMEWYGAFGLIVTLIWLYLEILRLLAKIRRRK